MKTTTTMQPPASSARAIQCPLKQPAATSQTVKPLLPAQQKATPSPTPNRFEFQPPKPSPPQRQPQPQRQRQRRVYAADAGQSPALTFSPLAWLKLQFFLHAGDTEIGGFGVSRQDDLLYVEDFVTVAQATTCVTIEFDDTAVADYFDKMFDAGKTPAQFGRIWVHTHPGSSPTPSGTDELTFERVFGRCDWSIMFIIARTGHTYARLRFAAGPTATVLLPVRVDWSNWAQALVDQGEQIGELAEAWMDEYGQNIRPVMDIPIRPRKERPLDSGFARSRIALPTADDHRIRDDRDRIIDPDADWWEVEEEMAALAELEAADYFGGREVFI